MLDPGSKQYLPTTYNTYRSSREFGAERKLISDDDTGISSPPLWGTVSPARSPDQHHYRSLSPSSRAQAIARGQKELMEMVSKMPEGCYELSLRDIVEHTGDPAKENDQSFAEESFTDETISIIKNQSQRERKKKQVVQQQMSRSGSMDHNHNGGFLLNILFPVSFGSTKGKKTTKAKTKKDNVNVSSNSNSGSGRVSPRPLLVDGSVKSGENEWWKKNRFVEAEESESGGLSSNSGSSKSTGSSASTNSSTTRNNSATRHGEGGCWGFIFRKKGKKKAKEKGG